jgi:hypothetical protein
MNWLETQLKSWEPRRPSAKIERRLFPARIRRSELTRTIGWLAPATVCLLFALAVLKQENNGPDLSGHEPMIAMVMSNQSPAARLPGKDSLIQHNTVPVTFEWTNRGQLASNVDFMSLRYSTN